MEPTKTEYISNPFKMLEPSIEALVFNIKALLGLCALFLVPIGVAVIGIATYYLAKQSPLFIGLAFALGFVSVVVLVVISLWAIPALSLIFLASAQQQKITLGWTMSAARPFIGRSFLVVLLTVIAAMVGFIFFIIPGLIIIAWFTLSPYVVVSENLGVMASLKRSRELVRGRVWEIWGVSALPVVAGLIPFIGSFLNSILSFMLMPSTAIRYKQLISTQPQDRPPVHRSNYAIVIVPTVLITLVVAVLANSFTG